MGARCGVCGALAALWLPAVAGAAPAADAPPVQRPSAAAPQDTVDAPAPSGDPAPDASPAQPQPQPDAAAPPTEAPAADPGPAVEQPAPETVAEPEPPPAQDGPAPEAAAKPAASPGPPGTVSKPKKDAKPKRARNPLLVIAGGPAFGPHARGNEDCRPELGRCEKTGAFFGIGVQAELRVRIWRLLSVHTRALIVGNVVTRHPLYSGAYGLGVGAGLYGHWVFGRAEYLFFDAFGDNTFEPPFFTESVGRDVWQRHAGLVSFGVRKEFKQRWAAELWIGPMIGPRSTRTIADDVEKRHLITFLAGVNISYDILQRPWTKPSSTPASARR